MNSESRFIGAKNLVIQFEILPPLKQGQNGIKNKL